MGGRVSAASHLEMDDEVLYDKEECGSPGQGPVSERDEAREELEHQLEIQKQELERLSQQQVHAGGGACESWCMRVVVHAGGGACEWWCTRVVVHVVGGACG